MKTNHGKAQIWLLLLVLSINITANATIRRVGFFGTPVPGVDYSDFPGANNAAVAGDTILVYPVASAFVHGGISKRLIIIGSGAWLDSTSYPKGNAYMQAFIGVSLCSGLDFSPGSANSIIMGFDFQGQTIHISDNNITIRRNLNLTITLGVNTTLPSNNPQTISNIQLLENYRLGVSSFFGGFVYNNLNISNNLMTSLILPSTSNYNGTISNNVWAYDASLSPALNGSTTSLSNSNSIDFGSGTFLFQNNILCSYTVNVNQPINQNSFFFSNYNNVTFNYNLALQGTGPNQPPWGLSGAGNITTPVSNYNAIFQGFPAIGTRSADDRYMLAANSPALIANRPGSTIDAGMYAGNSPYKLSVIPTIPTIYKLSSPQGNNPTGSSIQINLSTRGNN